LRRGVKKNKPHATAQRRNEKLKKEINTENEIAKHIMNATFRIHRTGGIMEKLVATWRRGVKHLNLTQRRYGATTRKYDE